MATIHEALKSINAYPIPMRTIMEVANRRDVSLHAEAKQKDLLSKNYRLAKADLLLWLSFAPNISQGGQSFSFNEDERRTMRREANNIYMELEPSGNAVMPTFGYKGDRL